MKGGILLFILIAVVVVVVSVVAVVDGVPTLSSVTGSSVVVEKKVGDAPQASNIHSVPIDNPLVVKAAQYAVNAINEGYVRVLASPKYYKKGQIAPWFQLAEIKTAAVKPETGIKFYLDLQLVNALLDTTAENDDNNNNHNTHNNHNNHNNNNHNSHKITSEGMLNRFTSWRTEHMGNIPIEAKIDMQQNETPEEKLRIQTAFMMGIDPVKFRKMKTLPGQYPEMHRVTLFMDKRGEFEMEYHHFLSGSGSASSPSSSSSTLALDVASLEQHYQQQIQQVNNSHSPTTAPAPSPSSSFLMDDPSSSSLLVDAINSANNNNKTSAP